MTRTDWSSQLRSRRAIAVFVMALGLGLAVPSCGQWVGSGVEGVLTSCDPLFPLGGVEERDPAEYAACQDAADREQARLDAEAERAMYLTALCVIAAFGGLVWAVTLTNQIHAEEDYYDDVG